MAVRERAGKRGRPLRLAKGHTGRAKRRLTPLQSDILWLLHSDYGSLALDILPMQVLADGRSPRRPEDVLEGMDEALEALEAAGLVELMRRVRPPRRPPGWEPLMPGERGTVGKIRDRLECDSRTGKFRPRPGESLKTDIEVCITDAGRRFAKA